MCNAKSPKAQDKGIPKNDIEKKLPLNVRQQAAEHWRHLSTEHYQVVHQINKIWRAQDIRPLA